MVEIINGYCLMWLCTQKHFKSIFIDPPDNIGLHYKDYDDNMDKEVYFNWLYEVTCESLKRCDIFWISYYWEHDLKIKSMCHRILASYHPKHSAKTFIWRFTFGQHNSKDFGSGYRPILRIMKPDARIYLPRVPSARQEVYNDKRASEDGRVPDDVWEYPRVCGTHKERREWHSTQHPEDLMHRIIASSVQKDEVFVDLCAGSGTSLIVGKKYGFNVIGIERSKYYCDKIKGELGAIL